MGSHARGGGITLERTKPPRVCGSRRGRRRKVSKAERFGSQLLNKMPPVIGGLVIVGAAAGVLTTAPGDLAAHALAAEQTFVTGYTRADGLSARERAISRDLATRRALNADSLQAVVESQNRGRNLALQRLASSAEQYSEELKANRWVLPVGRYRLTGRYGDRSSLWSTFHTGLDFAAPTGTRIMSVAAGTVTFAGYDGAYGNKVVVRLRDGTEIWYCHQSRLLVSVGDSVAARAPIGEVGSTGNVTGPHLHLEVRPGGADPIDPETEFPRHDATP